MKKTVVAALLLAALVGSASAEVGVGLTAGYPLGYAIYYGGEPGALDPQPILMGATLKWKPSLLLIESGANLWTASIGTFISGYLDVGLSFDLWVFRFGVCSGVNLLYDSPGGRSRTLFGWDGRISMDVKLGHFSVGVSAAYPMELLMEIVVFPYGLWAPTNPRRLLAMQESLNVSYWF